MDHEGKSVEARRHKQESNLNDADEDQCIASGLLDAGLPAEGEGHEHLRVPGHESTPVEALHHRLARREYRCEGCRSEVRALSCRTQGCKWSSRFGFLDSCASAFSAFVVQHDGFAIRDRSVWFSLIVR